MIRGLLTVLSLVVVGLIATESPALAQTTVGLWRFEELTGPAVDSSGNGNNGTVNGGVIRGVPGYFGKAYQFPGQAASVSVPDSPSLRPGTRDFSFTVHLKTTVAPSAQVDDYDLIRKGLAGDAGGDFKMEVLRRSRVVSGVTTYYGQTSCHWTGVLNGSKVQRTITNGPSVTDGKWHTLTCTRTGSTFSLTVDGQVWKATTSLGSITPTRPLFIGAKDAAGNDQTTGTLDGITLRM
jgi:hypothetical protein